jgi:alkanesulfonate monooxygenase SsuD/methylene tetrahydromethanopterin reductase-like flavin-dependent oxidoreductase (luciferase family)
MEFATATPAQTTATPARTPERRRGRLKLGFLSNVPFTSEPGGAERGLREAIELFEYAESIGFDSGWVRQRHFDNYIASPLVLLAAVAQRTSAIRLGTAVVSVRFENPIRLAEDAATLDLLSGGRLELGMAGGMPGLEAVFGRAENEYRDETQERIRRFRQAITGQPLELAHPELGEGLPPFTVRPQSEGLDTRLWYGAGAVPSAAKAGVNGLNLLLSTLNHDPTSEVFEESQRDNITAYLDAYTGTAPPRVTVSRLFMPAVNARQRELYAEFDRIRQTEGAQGPRPQGALAPGTWRANDRLASNHNMPPNIQLCPIYHGDPDTVVAAAQDDAGLALADEMMIWLPPNFTLAENQELIENTVRHLAPELGWEPAGSTDRIA